MFRFIGVDPHFEAGEFDRLVNQTPVAPASERAVPGSDRRGAAPPGQAPEVLERPVFDQEDRDRLALHLMPDIERLRALTGLRFARWSL